MLRTDLLAFATFYAFGGSAAVFGVNVVVIIVGVPVLKLLFRIQTGKQIIKERIEGDANEKAALHCQ